MHTVAISKKVTSRCSEPMGRDLGSYWVKRMKKGELVSSRPLDGSDGDPGGLGGEGTVQVKLWNQ